MKKIKTPVLQEKEVKDPELQDSLFSLKGYIILNIIFWVYCLLQVIILRWIYRDAMGIIFFFTVLAAGFTVVSVYDYIYDRIALKHQKKESTREKQ
jgi:phosphatidylglycerophosphate synthase